VKWAISGDHDPHVTTIIANSVPPENGKISPEEKFAGSHKALSFSEGLRRHGTDPEPS
jgi:hypothetical protein